MLKRKLLSLLLATCLCSSVIIPFISTTVFAEGTTTITVDPSKQGNTVGALSENMACWSLNSYWTTVAASQPANYFSQNYPSIKRIELFSATGGGYTSKAESVDYNVSNMTGATITVLFQTSVEPPDDMKFWGINSNNWVSTQITKWTKTDTLIAGNSWTKRVYTINSIPSGTTIFKVQFPVGGLNSYNPQLSRVVITAANSITDDLNDWSKVGGHTQNLTFDTQNSGILEDTSRVMRTTNTRFTPYERITYNYSNITLFEVTALFASTDECIDDLQFFSSPDNSTWTQQTGWTNVDTLINENTWTKRVYTINSLPAGTNYIKVCFPAAGTNSWNPQLGQVIITAGTVITDNLNDWSKSSSHTSGLTFDTLNAAVLGDTSRVMRTNNYEGYPGTNFDRDLFKEPQNRNVLNDYDFSTLITACHNIVNQGLKPHIRLGNVPVKYSSSPAVGAFGTNVRPPDDYNVYYNYIKAIADAMKNEFGINEVKSWVWGMTAEIENRDWFCANDETSISTKIEFFKMYDYTVAALQDSLGASNVKVGVHSMIQVDGLWDRLEFIDHCAFGTNYKTGLTGTQLNYIDFSYYEAQAGNSGELENISGALGLCQSVDKLRDRAIQDGLTNLEYGIGEAGIGSDLDWRFIVNNNMGNSYEGSFDALIFKKLNDLSIKSWSRWALNTEVLWEGVPGVSSHVNYLAYKMLGENRVDAYKSGTPAESNDIVDSIAGFNSSANTIHVMAFNHNPSFTATGSEDAAINIKNIQPVTGNTVTVKKWMIDDANGNFWPTWWADRASHGVSDVTVNNYSPLSLTVPSTMTVLADKDYWYSRVPTYQNLAALSYTTTTPALSNNTLTLTSTIAQHGVVFYEITNACLVTTPTSQAKTITDNLDNWRVCNSHTSGLAFDTGNASALGDTSRAMRTDTNNTQNVIYNAIGINSISATGLFATDNEAINDFKFYTSPDRKTWTLQTSWSKMDTLINSGNWTKRVYTLGSVPSETNYVKIEFPAGGANSWNPQLSQVQVNY
jgi:hypothetical protein